MEDLLLDRRRFIQLGSIGLAASMLGGYIYAPASISASNVTVRRNPLSLTVREVFAEMIDLTRVPMWAFDDGQLGPRVPGPVLIAVEGDIICLKVKNLTEREHAFSVPGIVQSDIIQPGKTLGMEFRAPSAGVYLYLDPLNTPVNRVMGLHGPLLVIPRSGATPYTKPSKRVQALFNDLGASARFPGEPWKPERTWVWVFNSIDPIKNEWVSSLPPDRRLDASEFLSGYLPRFFTINGKTGYFAAHDPEIMPTGKVGQPGLLRVLNAGVAVHSAHIHGNHVFLLAENGITLDNVLCVDTWSMPPGSAKDILLPFSRPPDIPPKAWPPKAESFPFHYPIHCHTQMSQTAAGGNYPQGLSVHWMLLSD